MQYVRLLWLLRCLLLRPLWLRWDRRMHGLRCDALRRLLLVVWWLPLLLLWLLLLLAIVFQGLYPVRHGSSGLRQLLQ